MENNLIENSFEDIIMFINIPILVKAHEHPLLLCFCQRNDGKGWVCDKCRSEYSYCSPSFYCTFCDYDLCQKCIWEYKLNQIKKSSRNINNIINNQTYLNKNFAWQNKFKNHAHSLSLIKRINNHIPWICDNCNQIYKKKQSYYCSLCDYNICDCCYKLSNRKNIPIFNDCSDSEYDIESFPIKPKSPGDITFFNIERPLRKKPDVYKKKPVIYLYPEKEKDISVQLDFDFKKIKFIAIYPKFNEGNNIWKVHAKPNGDIILKDKIYPYLFWEAQSDIIEEINEGFMVTEENAENFLEEKLKILGLNNKESTDFITYWLPY